MWLSRVFLKSLDKVKNWKLFQKKSKQELYKTSTRFDELTFNQTDTVNLLKEEWVKFMANKGNMTFHLSVKSSIKFNSNPLHFLSVSMLVTDLTRQVKLLSKTEILLINQKVLQGTLALNFLKDLLCVCRAFMLHFKQSPVTAGPYRAPRVISFLTIVLWNSWWYILSAPSWAHQTSNTPWCCSSFKQV